MGMHVLKHLSHSTDLMAQGKVCHVRAVWVAHIFSWITAMVASLPVRVLWKMDVGVFCLFGVILFCFRNCSHAQRYCFYGPDYPVINMEIYTSIKANIVCLASIQFPSVQLWHGCYTCLCWCKAKHSMRFFFPVLGWPYDVARKGILFQVNCSVRTPGGKKLWE